MLKKLRSIGSLTDFFGLRQSIVAVLLMAILVGMGEKLAERFLPIYILADLALALAGHVAWVVVGAALWGLHMAFTQGLFSALVADTSGAANRGTAFGVYGLATGLAVFLASLAAGWLWDQFGAPATFFTGAGFSFLALVGLSRLRK